MKRFLVSLLCLLLAPCVFTKSLCPENIRIFPYGTGDKPYIVGTFYLCDMKQYKKGGSFYKPTKCINCRTEFTPYNHHHAICSDKCRDDFNRRLYEEKHTAPRFKIFERDGFRCSYCGLSSIEDGIKLTVDHIIPIDKGGNSNALNLTTSCSSCNSSKKQKIMDSWIVDRIMKRNMQRSIFFIEDYSDLQGKFDELWGIRKKRRT